MKLYAYCLVEDLDTLDTSVRGIAGATVRLIKVDELAILVSDSESDAVPVTRENALTHAAVVRSVLDRTTPLPFRFGTLVTEQQLRGYISARKPALLTQFAHVHGCIEMSVKIIWQPPTDNRGEQPVTHGAGTTFLAEKRREILGDERRSAQATAISTWLRETLNGLTRDEQVTVRPAQKLVLSAAHLVEWPTLPKYRETVATARQARPELHFLVSGPWPPYSFANIELEFKTQFGVS
jgi:Gas vesicle synthesis protein GvpL/GvpF